MLYLVGLLCSYSVLVAGGRSPNADYIESITNNSNITAYVSDNLLQDALLDVPGLIRKYGYPFEGHSIITDDGYILTLHRIPRGREANNWPGSRPAVLLMHGLISSSADYVVMGPGSALGYLLADAGYDVWMGNARGNFYSRRHLLLNPDSLLNTNFWDFSWDEIGNRDLPAMIDYILRRTRRSALHYVGISQATTAFFVMASLRPQYNNKIISMHALAPVTYLAHNKNRLLQTVSRHARSIEMVAASLGFGEVFPGNWQSTAFGLLFCRDGAITQTLCSNLMYMIGGRSEDQHNATMLPVKLGHVPAGASLRQFAHYAQSIADKGFRRYDYGTLTNLAVYGRLNPPNYDLSRITAPVFLHYSESDPLAELEDVERLYKELGGQVKKHRVPLKTFSHVDFMWGIDAKKLVYDLVIDLMKSMDVA